ncbi:plectin-like [Asterias rubens]|uniref:plectin-like n=1 Tax=Asterias rubens TaxID=7604 RepID=UPI001455D1BF|nr:plectin-like [Asterias rubens]
MATSDVEDLYKRLQTFQLQLKVILDRNEGVLQHLEHIEVAVNSIDNSGLDQALFTQSLQMCQDSSKQVHEIAESQCAVLEEQIKELVRHSDDDKYAGLNRVSDTTMSSVRQQLITQLDFNVELQKDKAELEARLAEQLARTSEIDQTNQELHSDVEESQKKMRSVLDRLDKTAKDAEDRLDSLETETKKAQKTSEEFQKLYETEKAKNEDNEKSRTDINSNTLTRRRKKSAKSTRELTPMSLQTRNSPTQPYLFQAPMSMAKAAGQMRPQNMDPKYLCLVDENKDLHSEVRRLRDENTTLMRSSKDSKRDVENIQRYIATCSTQRNELQIRLKREQEEHRKVVASMNKQAAVWISEKKSIRGMETTSRTAKIQAEPVFGGARRLKAHPVKLNEDRPRDIPVASW